MSQKSKKLKRFTCKLTFTAIINLVIDYNSPNPLHNVFYQVKIRKKKHDTHLSTERVSNPAK